MHKHCHVVLFSIFFTFLIVCSRIYVLHRYAGGISLDYTLGLLLGVVNTFTLGLLLSVMLLSFNKNLLNRILIFTIVTSIVIFEIACFHYEAEFGRLPSIDILYYISELKHLSSSLEHNIPLIELLLEALIVLLLFFSGVIWIQAINIKSRITTKSLEYLSAIMVLTSIVIQGHPAIIPDKYFWGSREPVLWILQSKFIRESYEFNELKLNEIDFNQFLQYHGVNATKPMLDPAYPLCKLSDEPQNKPIKRNVALLVLEGLGENELWKMFNAKPMMPNLQKIANDEIYFNNIFAPGIKSVQALPSIFSGLPANTYKNYLWHAPMMNFNGFPLSLAEEGYSTAYFHGSDLSFEQQREYLKEVGFQTFFEYDPESDKPVIAWGYDDGLMFDELENWIEESNQPFFTSLFTLSTHEPYVLPSDWQPLYSESIRTLPNTLDKKGIQGEQDTIIAIAETYSFLDYHLGEFYRWVNEYDEDVIVIITGDHAPHIVNDGQGVAETDFRFKVPLIITGLSEGEKSKYRNYTSRSGSLHDIPATLLDILGYSKMECDLGVSLVASEADWPAQRSVYSVGGDALEKIYLRQNDNTYVYDRVKKELLKKVGNKMVYPPQVEKDRVFTFINNINAIHYYLLEKNAFFPEIKDRVYQSIEKVSKPIFVSHRGNLHGEDDHAAENRPATLDKVLLSDMAWVEVDVQLTGDGTLVLLHDDYIIADDNSIRLSSLSYSELITYEGYEDVLTLEEALDKYAADLNMLIDVKPVVQVPQILHITREVSRIINEKKDKKRIIVDSFHDTIARSIKNQCDCEVGLDTPYQEKLSNSDLIYYKKMGMDWIYVHYSVIDQKLIQNAHLLGLKVMAYTVNSTDIIESWKKTELPDGIITDNENLIY